MRIYPRSKGLFLSLPHRQTMVLSTDSTIRELCSRITPTSQFSSLHFIASTAIGAKSIETRARTLHSRDTAFFWLRAARAKRQHWANERTFWRRLPDCRLREFSIHTVDATVTIWLPERRSCWGAAVTTPRVAVGGDCRLNTHLSRYLIAMLWGLDPALLKPSIINQLVTVFCTNDYQSPLPMQLTHKIAKENNKRVVTLRLRFIYSIVLTLTSIDIEICFTWLICHTLCTFYTGRWQLRLIIYHCFLRWERFSNSMSLAQAALLSSGRGFTENSWTSTDVGPSVPRNT